MQLSYLSPINLAGCVGEAYEAATCNEEVHIYYLFLTIGFYKNIFVATLHVHSTFTFYYC